MQSFPLLSNKLPCFKAEIVIYGGGVAGISLAKKLSSQYSVALVEPRDYFEVPMSAPRSLVEPDFANKALISLKDALPKVNLIPGKLVELGKKSATVETSSGMVSVIGRISVLATGYCFATSLVRSEGGTVGQRKEFYWKFYRQLLAAKRIVIVGGGPIGIEIAGEISESFPEKLLTLIESGERILKDTSPKAALHAEKELKKRGVIIKLKEKVIVPKTSDLISEGSLVTSTGQQIEADLILWCLGGSSKTGYLEKHYSHAISAQGGVKVTPHLQVEGTTNLFALGDLANLAENKMAIHTLRQVSVVANNINNLMKGKISLYTYKARPKDPTMFITLGRKTGVSHIPYIGVVTSSWLNRLGKAEHMLVPKFRKKLLGVHLDTK
jgi:NADH dehydrogenase FAD-containing subunit